MMEDHAVEEMSPRRWRRRTFPFAFKREAVERAETSGMTIVAVLTIRYRDRVACLRNVETSERYRDRLLHGSSSWLHGSAHHKQPSFSQSRRTAHHQRQERTCGHTPIRPRPTGGRGEYVELTPIQSNH